MRPPFLSADNVHGANKTPLSLPPPLGVQSSKPFVPTMPTSSRIREFIPRFFPSPAFSPQPSSRHRPLPPAPSDNISASAHQAARLPVPLLPPTLPHAHPAAPSPHHHPQLPSSLSYFSSPADPASARLLDSLSSAVDSARATAAAAAFLAASASSKSATATALATTAAAAAAAARSASSTASAAVSAAVTALDTARSALLTPSIQQPCPPPFPSTIPPLYPTTTSTLPRPSPSPATLISTIHTAPIKSPHNAKPFIPKRTPSPSSDARLLTRLLAHGLHPSQPRLRILLTQWRLAPTAPPAPPTPTPATPAPTSMPSPTADNLVARLRTHRLSKLTTPKTPKPQNPKTPTFEMSTNRQ